MHHSYQLTRYPIGSLKEIGAISWPLMLGLLSGSLMMFADRFLLARYSAAALNGAVTAGIAIYVVMVIPLIIAGISEVFVGRHHGAGKLKEVGIPVWQMIWLSVFTVPFFWGMAEGMPGFLFREGENRLLEELYFKWMIVFAPFFCSTLALMGFFIGIGQVRMVTWSALLGNMANIGLDVALIFGWGPFPEMGIKGAALATGLSQVLQTLFLMGLFLKKSHREYYGTACWQFNFSVFKEGFSIGAPAGVGRFLELVAHFVFFQLISLSSSETLTVVGIVQSFYLLVSFIIEGLSKGVSSIVSNLIGGQQNVWIGKVLKSAMLMQVLLFCAFGLILAVFWPTLVPLFFSESDRALLLSPSFLHEMQWSLCLLSLFFLFDGLSWIYIGLLTASGDTKFLLYASLILNWLFYLLPTYVLFMVIQKGSAINGWSIIVANSILACVLYQMRYRSGKWLKALSIKKAEEPALLQN